VLLLLFGLVENTPHQNSDSLFIQTVLNCVQQN